MPLLTRRALMGSAAGAMGAALITPRNALAQPRELDIRGGSFRPVNIAVTNFAGDAQQGAAMSEIIINNFRRSVYLAPVDPRTFADRAPNPDQAPAMDQWRMVNAQFLVTGRTGRSPDGRMRTEFRLWDVTTGQQVAESVVIALAVRNATCGLQFEWSRRSGGHVR